MARSVSRCPPWAAGSISTTPSRRPHHVAAPQVPVDPRGPVVVVVEVTRKTAVDDRVDQPPRARRSAAAPPGRPSGAIAPRRRTRPTLGDPSTTSAAAATAGRSSHPQSSRRVPHPNSGAPASCVTASRDPKSPAAERVGATDSSRSSVNDRSLVSDDPRTRHTTVHRQPAQPRRFQREEAGWRGVVGLDEVSHGAGVAVRPSSTSPDHAAPQAYSSPTRSAAWAASATT